MQRMRWFVVVGSLSVGLALLPLAGISCPPADTARAEQTALNEPTKRICEVNLADEGLNAATFKKLSSEEKLKYQLRRKVTLHLDQATIPQLREELEKALAINVILDKKAMEEAAFDTATPIDKVFSQPTELRGALRLLLHDLALSYVLEKDSLLITTKTAQENSQVIKHYPVGEFLRPVGTAAIPANQDYDSLIQLIQSIIQPTTWKANGGQGDVVPFGILDLLVVSNTQEVHEQLEDFFTELRKTHAAKAEAVQTNETGVIRMVYALRIPRAAETKLTRDKEGKNEETTTIEGEARFTMQELMALITKTIEPASWSDDKFSIAALGDTLVVTHTQVTQRKVQEFLSELRLLPGQNNSTAGGLGGVIGGAGSCGGTDGARSGGFF